MTKPQWQNEVEEVIGEFISEHLSLMGLVEVEFDAHQPPPRLPEGKVGIYLFWGDGEWLKIGKVGQNSQPRWTSHHYWGCAPSTLFGSLRSDPNMKSEVGVDREQV
jgi:hypothetical protein